MNFIDILKVIKKGAHSSEIYTSWGLFIFISIITYLKQFAVPEAVNVVLVILATVLTLKGVQQTMRIQNCVDLMISEIKNRDEKH